MRVPVKWLKEYVNIDDIAEKELVEKLVLTGSNNEGSHVVGEGLENIIVGKITKIVQHPNADKLCICMVDVGDDVLQIVTGATNISENDFIPVAVHGATIAGGIKIKKGKLRGEVSNGMLCSLEEMGFDKASIPKEFDDGIFILDKPYPLGMDILEALDLKDTVIEFEITPNRSDCLSMIGMARETAASFERALTLPSGKIDTQVDDVNEYASVSIEAPDLCPRYVAKVVKEIKIEKSPIWLQMRLMNAGMRPINNIVDITNYVMLEYGQPIHAFDLDTVKDHKIIVKRAENGEKFTTLDDKERELTSEMLVIADAERTIGIAGVMGGENTEISKATQNILIEVASFDKSSIRKTSKDLGLRTEASSRYEKGVSTGLPMIVVNRVCELIETLGAGTVVGGAIDVYPTPVEPILIPYRVEKISKVIGETLTLEEIIKYLDLLGIKTLKKEGQQFAEVPYYRLDLTKEIDLVEEVARIYGYDKIGMTLPKTDTWGARTNAQLIEEQAKLELLSSGIDEILTYSFVSKKDLDKINLSENSILRKQVELINPLGEEYSVMRTSLIPNVLDVLARNSNRKVNQARIFEIGSVFLPKEVPVVNLPIEKKMLTIGMYGESEDFFTLKGACENILDGLGICDYYFEKEENHPTFHTGRCANIIWGTHVIGTIGELHPHVQENYDLQVRGYLADLDFNMIIQMANADHKFVAIPKYPAIERDIAILVKDEITSLQIEKIVVSNGGNLLESVKMFDMYKGKQIPAGYKSVAYELIFRAEDRTLVDEDVNAIFATILKALENKLEAQLR
ncbi:phenylalanine--tRNA ligase subunit beta [Fusibacter ferrireducens]|uniref:Phenylalanine--tRNA ligase beta subunit n=1 Tax=Fusibacter ferrireducens TaxID=2785058 RepID=A0ABR9ZQV5_9FIRM|nr:phenylalanine--tRNA ligase subunit beta [Fusibacter ferrireducens]MBF4692837.1 phenylalanine--tRNA ligase subunit beta [Fusibacter ferrireducens]